MKQTGKQELIGILFESFSYPMFVVDIESFEVLLANPAAMELNDENHKATLSCYALTHRTGKPCNTNEHPCPLKILKKTKKPAVVEHIHYDAEGMERLVEVHCNPIFDEKGKLAAALEYHLDVTELRNTQVRLRESYGEIENQQKEIQKQKLKLEEQLQKLDIAYEQIRSINRKLIEKEKSYRMLSDLTFEGILIHQRGLVIDVNDSFLNIFGYRKEELLGKNVVDKMVPPEYLPAITNRIDNKVAEPYEIEAKRKDGVRIPVEIESRDVEYDGEKVRVTAVRDITEKKAAEKQLKTSQESIRLHHDLSHAFLLAEGNDVYQRILEILLRTFSCPYGLFGFINQDGHFEIPSMTYDIWDECNIPGKTFVFTPEQWGGIWGKTLLERKTFIKNHNLEFPVGHIVLHSAICTPIIYKQEIIGQFVLGNKENGFLEEDQYKLESIARYIAPILFARLETEKNVKLRIRTEEKLKLSEFKYRDLIDALGEGVGIVDMHESFIFVNDKGAEIFGLKREELNGKNLREFLDQQSIERVIEETKNREEGKSTLYELQIISAQGTRKILLVTASPRYDLHGMFIGTLGIFRDITDRKIMEGDLIKAKEKAEESDRLKTAFLTNMSHEIRTPLNAIMGFAELLKENSLSQDNRKDFIDTIINNGRNLLNIISDIIDLSRIESGDLKMNPQICILHDFMQNLVGDFESVKESQRKNDLKIKMVKGNVDESKKFLIDSQRLKQVLMNLVSNAIKFTERGEIVTGYTVENHFIQFYVSDTGIGMNESQLEHIFERFRQVDEGNTRKYGGTGVGLAISKAVVEKMGGSIQVDSRENEGSVFSFRIPVILPEEDMRYQYPLETAKLMYRWPGKRIMVVDDDNSVLQFLYIVLKKTGADVVTCKSAESALEIIKEDPALYHLILLDMRMPGMDGYTATKIIKELNQDIIIIAQTAYALNDDPRECYKAGCDNYISKPIMADKLLQMCHEYLGD